MCWRKGVSFAGIYTLDKLNEINNFPIISEITKLSREWKFSDATIRIDYFLNLFKNLDSIEKNNYKFQLFETKNLETQLINLVYKKLSIEKVIHNFNIKHFTELGSIINEIFQFRRKLKSSFDNSVTIVEYINNFKTFEISGRNLDWNSDNSANVEICSDLALKILLKSYPLVHSKNEYAFLQNKYIKLKNAFFNDNLDELNIIFKDLDKGVIYKFNSSAFQEKLMGKNPPTKILDNFKQYNLLIEAELKNVQHKISSLEQSSVYSIAMDKASTSLYFETAKLKLKFEYDNLLDNNILQSF